MYGDGSQATREEVQRYENEGGEEGEKGRGNMSRDGHGNVVVYMCECRGRNDTIHCCLL